MGEKDDAFRSARIKGAKMSERLKPGETVTAIILEGRLTGSVAWTDVFESLVVDGTGGDD